MLLTLATRSFVNPPSSKNGIIPPSCFDLPEFARRQLKLRGLNVMSSMLAGWNYPELDRLRDRADKAGCPCLVLVEDQPMPLGAEDSAVREQAAQRVETLAMAANRLGCNALALHVQADDDDESFERVTQVARDLLIAIERHELNLLLAPSQGLLFQPDRLIEVIKRIGGFRIGALPSFAHAHETGEAIETLRQLAPYAGAIHASVSGFGRAGKHQSFDLTDCVRAIRSVGFSNTLAIDYLGMGDPVDNVEKARTILEEAIEAETA
jgi:sugar phosphate isomerase/epimerase